MPHLSPILWVFGFLLFLVSLMLVMSAIWWSQMVKFNDVAFFISLNINENKWVW